MKITLEASLNFDFDKLNKKMKDENWVLNITGKNSTEGIKRRIMDGGLTPLKDSTMKIRQERGISGAKPLFATGALYNSITEQGDGIRMLEYGAFHHEGFTPKKIPYKSLLSKRKGKTFFVNNTSNIPVPARPFILPDLKELNNAAAILVKEMRKALTTKMRVIR